MNVIHLQQLLRRNLKIMSKVFGIKQIQRMVIANATKEKEMREPVSAPQAKPKIIKVREGGTKNEKN